MKKLLPAVAVLLGALSACHSYPAGRHVAVHHVVVHHVVTHHVVVHHYYN